MTIEEEIRRRLRAMGLDEESVEPCMAFVKDDPLMGGTRWEWGAIPEGNYTETVWHCARSSALGYLENKCKDTTQHILNAVSLMEAKKKAPSHLRVAGKKKGRA